MGKNRVKPKWRVNTVVTYLDRFSLLHSRETALQILKNLARIRKIECEIAYEYPFFVTGSSGQYTEHIDNLSDLVYFRSTRQTSISAKEFRSLIDHIFSDESLVKLSPFEVFHQMQKNLREYPFPVK